MKMKTAFAGLLVVLFTFNALPVQATDFSGYVQSTFGSNWTWGEWAHVRNIPIEGGEAWMLLTHDYIQNIGGVILTEAIRVVKLFQLKYYDESGTLITVTDPVELAQFVRVENSEEMWNGGYVTWLGTIKPGDAKRSVLRFWIGVSNWSQVGYHNEVWYLP